ncbi:MAG TPA: hypothetical protein VIL28_07290 [Steroidobacteraceae bacterium]
MASSKTKRASHRPHPETPILEWLLGGIGCALVIACIAFLIYQGVNDGERPGRLISKVLSVTDTGDGYVARFTIHNAGSQALANLHVRARLLDSDRREVERATVVIDYVPGHSLQQGGFYFQHDPRKLEVEIRGEGYQKP